MERNFLLQKLEIPGEISRQKTIGKQVFELLRQAIIQQQLRPGNLLSEADVAKQIGTSRQPVREAFIKLADIGLVKVQPQRGTFVTLISTTGVEKARFIREAIEVAIVRKVACEVKDKDIVDLEKLIELQKEVNASKDYPQFLQLGEEFHARISEIADFTYVWSVLENPKSQIDRVRYLNLPGKARADRAISQHQAIVDALATHSPDVAGTAMSKHLKGIMNSLALIAKEHPDLFSD